MRIPVQAVARSDHIIFHTPQNAVVNVCFSAFVVRTEKGCRITCTEGRNLLFRSVIIQVDGHIAIINQTGNHVVDVIVCIAATSPIVRCTVGLVRIPVSFQVGNIRFQEIQVLDKGTQINQGNCSVLRHCICAGRIVIGVPCLQISPGDRRICASGVIGVHIQLEICQRYISVFLRRHRRIQCIIDLQHIHQIGGQVCTRIGFIQLILGVLADHRSQGVKVLDNISVFLVHDTAGCLDGIPHFLILSLRIAGNRCRVGSDGTNAVLVGCLKLRAVEHGIGIVGVQGRNTAVLGVHGAPQRAAQQVGRVQLGRTQGQIVDAVGGVRQVDEIAPLQVGKGHIDPLGQRLVHIEFIRGQAVLIRQCDLQIAVAGDGRIDARDLRGPGQSDPCKRGRDHHHRGHHQQQRHCRQPLLQSGQGGLVCTDPFCCILHCIVPPLTSMVE